uniref:RNA-binding protein 42-like n=1 Tax=Jaculus jaculus TaxID=51337 RepID=UPI001E1B1DD6|nr:RNA-binding protein 42-like [Jaculus jaculus]
MGFSPPHPPSLNYVPPLGSPPPPPPAPSSPPVNGPARPAQPRSQSQDCLLKPPRRRRAAPRTRRRPSLARPRGTTGVVVPVARDVRLRRVPRARRTAGRDTPVSGDGVVVQLCQGPPGPPPRPERMGVWKTPVKTEESGNKDNWNTFSLEMAVSHGE